MREFRSCETARMSFSVPRHQPQSQTCQGYYEEPDVLPRSYRQHYVTRTPHPVAKNHTNLRVQSNTNFVYYLQVLRNLRYERYERFGCFDRVVLEKTETAASELSKRDANGPSASSR